MNPFEEQKSEPTEPDFANDKVVQRVLETADPVELQKFKDHVKSQGKQVTEEEWDHVIYYAKLRRKAIESIGEAEERIRRESPPKSQLELDLGMYVDLLEPQVRDAVVTLRKKGYSSWESGFGGYDQQIISFEEDHLKGFSLTTDQYNGFLDKGFEVAVEPNRISFRCKRKVTLEEMKEVWDELADLLPQVSEYGVQSQTRAAKYFRGED